MGCSIIQDVLDADGNKITEEFAVNLNNFDSERISDRYYGITTHDWGVSERVDGLKDPSQSSTSNGLMTGPGQFSSIKEHLPLTAFIQERRDAVESYLKKIKQRAQGAQFANIQRYPKSER